jgi:hypothetical protein
VSAPERRCAKSWLLLQRGSACLLALAFCQIVLAESQSVQPKPSTQTWIDRQWEFRYFIHVTQSWPNARAGAIQSNLKPGLVSLNWKAVMEPVTLIPIPDAPIPSMGNLAVSLIEFNESGGVLSSHQHGSPLRGRIDVLRRVVLSEGDAPRSRQYRLGEWFTGLGDISTHWAPGLCGIKEMPSPFSRTDEYYLYGPKFQFDEQSVTFGCREWAYQLYDNDRSYIDVTSYVRIGKVYPKYTFIREFIGWARFEDKKPIIGKHEKQWYCLHDCPSGNKPGPIADINQWAAKQGWKAPKPPTKAPTFPDPPNRSGTYSHE